MSEHSKSVHVEGILVSKMVSRTSPQEKVVAVVASVRLRVKEASVSIVAQRLGAVLAVAHTETDAGISLPLRVGIVDIHRSVSSALGNWPRARHFRNSHPCGLSSI